MPDFSPPATNGSSPDLSGRQLGDFRLLRRLGRGAMADVYLAQQDRPKRSVALKILKPQLAADPTYLQRFELEAQAAASLIHANIVQIYEVGCVDRLHYIAQEYVSGQNLREYLARRGPPDLARALSIMRQVASALDRAAGQGVVHRDIKPENILLTAGGEVKVADFGLARLQQPEGSNDLTQVGITLGTPLYMSPEQVEGKPLDPRSDLYSFGVTCYEMLGGSPPFSAETALGLAVQHLKRQPAPLESLRGDLPPALCRIVHQLLAKEPTDRTPSARELLRQLRRLQIEHFGVDWPEDLPGWDASSASGLEADPCAAATRRVDWLMKTMTAMRRSRMIGRAWIAMTLLAAFLFGATGAWWAAAPTPLLAEAKSARPTIQKQSSVLRQWYLASQIGTEAAWQSVIDYFPDKQYFTLRAQQQLALIYLRRDDLDRAMQIFNKLAALGDDEPELRAFGLAGQCGVLSIRGHYQQSNDLLVDRLWPLRDRLRSRPMVELVDHAVRKNREKLGGQTALQWDKWFEDQAQEGP